MAKRITNNLKQVYDFFVASSKEKILKGETIPSVCYALIFNDKEELSIMPMPIQNMENAEERRQFMTEMGKVLRKNKVNVKMFMFMTETWMSKVDKNKPDANIMPSQDPKRIECFIVSGRDCFDNTNYQIYEIKRDGKNVNLSMDEKVCSLDWKNKKDKSDTKVKDTLLDSIWSEYRNIKNLK